ncbi:MAG: serine/threonine-protein kinase [Pirellula sp.]
MGDSRSSSEKTPLASDILIDSLCDEFELACQSGAKPDIEAFLARIQVRDRLALLLELVDLDVYYRKRRDESLSIDEYQARFPDLPMSTLVKIVEQTMPDNPLVVGPVPITAQSAIENESVVSAPLKGRMVRYFGDYEILDVVAQGGMGVVYRARQVSLNRIVALKMILSGELAAKEEVDRFYLEAKAAAMLDHPGIVPIYEVGEYNGQHFFSMAFVEGSSLAEEIRIGPLEPIRAARLMIEVAKSIHYAHEQGIIHRDLKPSNVLVDAFGHTRITDFGLAKHLTESSSITVSGQVIGTPSFMPPEQAVGKIDSIGPASDVYATGAVLYTATVGRPPFQAASRVETLRQVIESEPVAPRQLNASIPRDLETIILKCLEKSVPR